MKSVWLQRAGHPRVLIFFAGWGMNDAPFRGLISNRWDVLVYYDFRRLDEVPCVADLDAYPETALAAWSLGCAAANRVAQERRWTFSRALAINGTLIPEDDLAGIPARWIDATAQHLTEGGWEKFVGRMCPDAKSRTAFDAGRPDRDLQGAVEELRVLRRLPPPPACVFTAALVSELDRIILPENQRRCWERYGVAVRPVRGPHYPFHLWASWDEVIACTP
jgi:hypothetical protein